MSAPAPMAVHASALVVGEAGILIRGASGTGKSRLALLLLAAVPRTGGFARLVGDDRIVLQPHGGAVIASPHPAIAGLLERRTQPFAFLRHEGRCVVRLVVELWSPDRPLPRYPAEGEATTELAGVAGLPLLRLQGVPDTLSCHLVLEALGMHPTPLHEP